MKPSSSKPPRLPLVWQYLAIYLMVAMMFPPSLMANGPGWWTSGTSPVITTGTNGQPLLADDYAAANQGQVKNIATAAANNLSNLPGGSGTAVQNLVTSWQTTGTATDDYAGINLGQLKNVAQPFYDRLIAVGYTNAYPWLSSTNAADDYALANIGQVKNLFSFDVTYESNPADGVPDWWEIKYFGSDPANWLTGTTTLLSGALNPDGTPVTLLEAYQDQLNPVTTTSLLLGDWEFDDGSGTVAVDSSGNGDNATLTGTGATWGIGYNGLGSLAITGTDGHASIPDNTHQLFSSVSGSTSGPFSISFWFNLNSIPQGVMSPLMETCQPGGTGFRCGVDYGAYHPGHAPMFIFWTEGGGNVDLKSETVIQPQTWYHAVITDDGTTAKMYLNGQLESTSSGTVLPNNAPLLVGNWSDYHQFTGFIDNLLVYSKALRASDAQALYNADSDGNGLPDWWEVQYFGAIGQTATAAVPSGQLNSDGTPVTLLEAYQDQYNPNDAYNGVAPTISIVSGTNQSANLNSFLPRSLVIRVSGSNGIYANAPVNISMTQGSGEIGSGTSTDTLTYSQTFYTGTDGQVTFYGYTGSMVGTDIVTANAGPTAAAQITFQSINAPIQLSAGANHVLALKADGTVWAWGANNEGQLGDGGTAESTFPVEVPGAPDIIAVSAGSDFSLALDSNGRVWSWGDNSSGQLGTGTSGTYETTLQSSLSGDTGHTAIAAGYNHALALDQNGSVWAWGDNTDGELGIGSTGSNSASAVQVVDINGDTLNGYTAIAAGNGFSVALNGTDGSIWTWGSINQSSHAVEMTNADSNPLTGFRTTAAGNSHAVALDESGNVWAWGDNTYGQLGNGTTGGNSAALAPVKDSNGNPLSGFTAISAQGNETIALKNDGTIWEWGDNQNSAVEVPDTVMGTVIAAGGTGTTGFGLTVQADGTTWSWGNNSNGQLGDGNTTNSSAPVDVIWPDHTHQTVSSGPDFTVTIRNDGTVWSWGDNSSGQLGDGIVNANSHVPVQTLGLTQVVAVVAGNSHALALKNDGTVWAWGNNQDGQLGQGTTANAKIPVQIPNLTNIIAIAAGENHSMALKSDGTVYVWGSDSNGQIGSETTSSTPVTSPYQVTALPSGITTIGAGSLQSYAVTGSGNVYAWGNNSNGQIGNNATSGNQLTPALVVSDTSGTPLSGITTVSGGYLHALALKNDGTVWAWGGNSYGQLGNGTNTDSDIAVEALSPNGTTPLANIVAVAATGDSSQAIDWDGTLWSWGNDSSGQLGDGTTTNSNLAEENDDAGGDVVAVSGGGNAAGTSGNTITIDAYGNVWAWGDNSSGQLGFGSTVSTNVVSEVGVPQSSTQSTLPGTSAPPSNLPNVLVAAGAAHTLYLANDGTVWAWGDNTYGELGNGATTSSDVPVQVKGLSRIVAVAGGDNFSVALRNDGTVWAWGYNNNGELGDSGTTNSLVPIQVNDPSDPTGFLQGVTAITAGPNFAAALKNDGTVRAWGLNGSGQLGNGTTSGSLVPVEPVNANDPSGYLTGIVEISAGGGYLTALDNSGNVWAWGANDDNQLAGAASGNSDVPVQINSLSGIVAISAGGSAASQAEGLALTNTGAVMAWGDGNSTPTQVTGLSGITALAAGNTQSLFLDGAGNVWTWTNSGSAATQVTPLGNTGAVASAISIGEDDHAVALLNDGTLWTWGNNSSGQLGNATTTNSTTPVEVWWATPVKQSVAVGTTSTLLLQGNGTVWSFGGGTSNQPTPINALGQVLSVTGGTATNSGLVLKSDGTVWSATGTSSTQITGLSNIVAISQSEDHALALKSDGTVYAWGSDFNGQLGDNSTTDESSPVQSGSGILSGVIAVSAGYQYSMALTANGTVYTWGANSLGQLGNSNTTDQHLPVPVTTDGTTPLTAISAISAGGSHALAIGEDTSLWTWGDNSNGQLGNSSITAGSSNVPVQVTDSNGNVLYGAMAISAGPLHSVALMNDSSVWAWGANAHGQLGNATTTDSNVPVPVVLSDGTTPLINIATIGAGGDVTNGDANTVALNANGTVWAWGSNENNQLANGTGSDSDVAIQVPGILISNKSTSIGTDQTLMLKGDGTVWALGGNSFGQLGNGSTSDTYTTVSGQVIAMDHALGVIAGNYSSFAVKQDGSAWGWGWNGFGQLGNGSLANSDLPVQITGSNYVEMSAGDQDAVALKADGTVWDFGDNEFGQLGNSGTTNSASPVEVETSGTLLTAVVQVVSGAYHNLALDASGNVWAWGYNGDGELGTGGTANSDVAVQVSGLSNVIEIAAGDYHSLALTADGSIYAWGANWGGQLGLGNTTDQLTPQLVSGPGSAVGIAAAGDHSLSLSGSGSVNGWGYNGSGELGLPNAGSTVTTPTLISGLTGVVSISSGKQNSSVHSTGTQSTLGSNSGSGNANGTPNGGNNAQPAQPQNQNQNLPNLPWGGDPDFTTAGYQPAPECGYVVIDLTQVGVTDPNADPISVNDNGQILVGGTAYLSGSDTGWLGNYGYGVWDITSQSVTTISSNVPTAQSGTETVQMTLMSVGVNINKDGTVIVNGFGLLSNDNPYSAPITWNNGQYASTYLPFASGTNPPNPPIMCQAEFISGSGGTIYAGGGEIDPENAESDPAQMNTVNSIAVQWTSGSASYLGTYTSSTTGTAYAIASLNNTGDMVGTCIAASITSQNDDQFLYDNGEYAFYAKAGSSPTPLKMFKPIPGVTGTAQWSNAFGINDGPQTVGSDGTVQTGSNPIIIGAETYSGSTQTVAAPIMWLNVNGTWKGKFFGPYDLTKKDETLASGSPIAVNNQGVILGDFISTSGTYLGDLWRNGNIEDIQSLAAGWNITEVNAISGSTGIIVGTGEHMNTTGTAGDGTTRPIMLVPAQLIVDANRDGQMSTTDPTISNADVTTGTSPFVFWLNNNYDGYSPDDPGEQVGLEPMSDKWDYKSDYIQCTRDLEDFARLWINVPALLPMIQSGKIQVGLKFVPNSGNQWQQSDGNPSIKIFLAADTQNGGDGYLIDGHNSFNTGTDWADEQIGGEYDVPIEDAKDSHTTLDKNTFILPSSVWSGLSSSQPTLHLLFEACTQGKGKLVLVILDSQGNEIGGGAPLFMDLRDIKELYERWTVGDVSSGFISTLFGYSPPSKKATISTDRLPDAGETPLTYSGTSQGLSVSSDPNGNKYILFVHGWNLPPWDKDNFAETAFKRLYWQGYKGKFGTFQWPTTTNISQYDSGEYQAWLSATPLYKLLTTLSNKYNSNNLNVLAHSMGNVVTGEALRLAAVNGQANLVANYVASQAAIPAHCWDGNLSGNNLLGFAAGLLGPSTPNIYNNWMLPTSTKVKFNFSNVNDYALDKWEYDQELKPDPISGPRSAYYYIGDANQPATENGFVCQYEPQHTIQSGTTTQTIPTSYNVMHLGNTKNLEDRYEIMAFASEPRSRALGEIGDKVKNFSSLNLPSIWPKDTFNQNNEPYSAHPWHSAEFEMSNYDQYQYWQRLMDVMEISTNH